MAVAASNMLACIRHEDGAIVERIRVLPAHTAVRIEDRIKQVGFVREWNLSCRICMEVNDDRNILVAMSCPVRDRGQEDLEIERAISIRIDALSPCPNY